VSSAENDDTDAVEVSSVALSWGVWRGRRKTPTIVLTLTTTANKCVIISKNTQK